MTGKLGLDAAVVREARELARRAGEPITELARTHTTVSVERAVLRLAGLDGADSGGMPWVNRLTDAVRDSVGLEHGVALPAWDAMATGGHPSLRALAEDAAAGRVTFRIPAGHDAEAARAAASRSVRKGFATIDARRAERDRMLASTADPPKPWIYLIVATGDIYEDIPQAQAAAREGADIIAVIRSTGQSLLDYVPEGATREGYAGTYATRENFALMRAALDDTSREMGRYVRLTNYASGLCMPEIAALAGLERLDMMLNDCMYGIIFRDINPRRTFIDQRFSRQIHARAGIIINTGEDNYLTTADAVDAAHTVIVSQLLNEYFGKEAGLADAQLGLGHAFEINPAVPDSFLLELAHAQLVRELFPDAPLKYMPPTKHMSGNIFAGYLLDAFFNLCGLMTDQSILLVGMMTEGIHTPFLADRDLALENVRYVRRAAGKLGASFRPEPGGFVARRAREVLASSVGLLRRICDEGLLAAIANGTFGVTRRPPDGGRGLDGVIERADGYFNPAAEILDAAGEFRGVAPPGQHGNPATGILDGVRPRAGDLDGPGRRPDGRPYAGDPEPVEAP
ncbi:MAG TPA: lysine 5,6-aminomutase subunit alpha [Streptosporangiaceae bacterium]|nr:lysine 5,6-aminomutase subunit alpha [Streptosporangiaceae bacterium]